MCHAICLSKMFLLPFGWICQFFFFFFIKMFLFALPAIVSSVDLYYATNLVKIVCPSSCDKLPLCESATYSWALLAVCASVHVCVCKPGKMFQVFHPGDTVCVCVNSILACILFSIACAWKEIKQVLDLYENCIYFPFCTENGYYLALVLTSGVLQYSRSIFCTNLHLTGKYRPLSWKRVAVQKFISKINGPHDSANLPIFKVCNTEYGLEKENHVVIAVIAPSKLLGKGEYCYCSSPNAEGLKCHLPPFP